MIEIISLRVWTVNINCSNLYCFSKAVWEGYLGMDYAWTIAKLGVGMLIVNILSKLELWRKCITPYWQI